MFGKEIAVSYMLKKEDIALLLDRVRECEGEFGFEIGDSELPEAVSCNGGCDGTCAWTCASSCFGTLQFS